MFPNFGEAGQLPFKQLEAISSAATTFIQGWQQSVSETTNFAKQSYEKNRALAEKLLGVTTLEEAVRLHSEFTKATSEGVLSHITKIGNLHAKLAADLSKPALAVLSTAIKDASIGASPKSPFTGMQQG